MKKILFISSLDSTGERLKYDGVMKKILCQIKTLEEMGYYVDYIKRSDDSLFLCNNTTKIEDKLIEVQSSFYSTMKKMYSCLTSRIQSMDYDIVYMRYETSSLAMSRFFKRIKAHNKRIQLYSELPTYMGKWEPGITLFAKVKFIINLILRTIIPLNVDRVVTFSDHDRLFGIKTIKIENFADISQLPLRVPVSSDDFHMLGVAMMTASHGFDRVIKGLNQYYKGEPSQRVFFHIIGNGPVVPEWKRLVVEYELEDYVFFEGVKSGEELDEYFNKCQIAVASLAIFRKKCPKASELKIREYTARGIPFIYSAYEPQFEDLPFCLKVPHDESPINIQEVMDFYKKVDIKKTAVEMRDFALNNCTCRAQFEKVFSNINDERF